MIKNANIKEMFNSIAKNYDKINSVISFGMHKKVKKIAIANANLKPNFKVLDICTGTGDIAIYVAGIVKNGEVVGVDFSENMLELARKKAAGIENIEFKFADALELPFGDNEFDASFISFGLRNVPDYKKCLDEMKRVTKNGGIVVNIDTGKPKGFFALIFKLYFFHIVPVIGSVLGGEKAPYKYLPESTEEFPNSDELVKLFKEIGLKNVKKYEFLGGAISEQIGEA